MPPEFLGFRTLTPDEAAAIHRQPTDVIAVFRLQIDGAVAYYSTFPVGIRPAPGERTIGAEWYNTIGVRMKLSRPALDIISEIDNETRNIEEHLIKMREALTDNSTTCEPLRPDELYGLTLEVSPTVK